MNRINTIATFSLLFLIIIFSLIPLPAPRELERYHIDKIGHIVFYALFGYFAYSLLGLFSVIFGIALGIITESLQRFIPTREPSLSDFASNLVGIGLGILIRRIKRSS